MMNRTNSTPPGYEFGSKSDTIPKQDWGLVNKRSESRGARKLKGQTSESESSSEESPEEKVNRWILEDSQDKVIRKINSRIRMTDDEIERRLAKAREDQEQLLLEEPVIRLDDDDDNSNLDGWIIDDPSPKPASKKRRPPPVLNIKIKQKYFTDNPNPTTTLDTDNSNPNNIHQNNQKQTTTPTDEDYNQQHQQTTTEDSDVETATEDENTNPNANPNSEPTHTSTSDESESHAQFETENSGEDKGVWEEREEDEEDTKEPPLLKIIGTRGTDFPNSTPSQSEQRTSLGHSSGNDEDQSLSLIDTIHKLRPKKRGTTKSGRRIAQTFDRFESETNRIEGSPNSSRVVGGTSINVSGSTIFTHSTWERPGMVTRYKILGKRVSLNDPENEIISLTIYSPELKAKAANSKHRAGKYKQKVTQYWRLDIKLTPTSTINDVFAKCKDMQKKLLRYGQKLGNQIPDVGLCLQEENSDEVWLNPEWCLWQYDIADKTQLEMKIVEQGKMERESYYYRRLRVRYFPAEDLSTTRRKSAAIKSYVFKFQRFASISEVIQVVQTRLKIPKEEYDYFGLFVCLGENEEGAWLKKHKVIESYFLQDMDIIEFKRNVLVIEFDKGPTQPKEKTLAIEVYVNNVLSVIDKITTWLDIKEKYGLQRFVSKSNGESPLESSSELTPEYLLDDQPFQNYIITVGEKLRLVKRKRLQRTLKPQNENNMYSFTVKYSPYVSQYQSGPETEELCVHEPGDELVDKLPGVSSLNDNVEPIEGVIALTRFNVVFVPDSTAFSVIEGPVTAIFKLSKKQNILTIYWKDFRPPWLIRFPSKYARTYWLQMISQHAFSGDVRTTYAKIFKEHFNYVDDGWNIYDIIAEFNRQFNNAGDKYASHWSITKINEEYKMSDTYPKYVGIPSSINLNEVLTPIFRFRSKGRIPVLSYLHTNGAALVRSAQPRVGLSRTKCSEDEFLLEAILRANPENTTELLILDARPRMNAMANQAMGAGVEKPTQKAYSSCRLEFLNIGNIHVMRESYNKLEDVFMDCDEYHRLTPSSNQDWHAEETFQTVVDEESTDSQRRIEKQKNKTSSSWLSSIEKSRWLEYINLLISCSTRITYCVHEQNATLLIHCSDGWDRTPQILGLSQILLDPYYRTIKGFEVLIEKEFVSFGHQFARRHGHVDSNYSDNQRCPVFLQFIDAVWQLTEQFPCHFEFNEAFLVYVIENVYSCKFGSFLCNNEKGKDELKVREWAVSIWSYTNARENRTKFYNPFYSPRTEVIYPQLGVANIKVWHGYFGRWYNRRFPTYNSSAFYSSFQQSRPNKEFAHLQLLSHIADLEAQMDALHNEVNFLKHQLGRDALNDTPTPDTTIIDLNLNYTDPFSTDPNPDNVTCDSINNNTNNTNNNNNYLESKQKSNKKNRKNKKNKKNEDNNTQQIKSDSSSDESNTNDCSTTTDTHS